MPRAFKAFARAFGASVSALCDAMAFSSRLLARSLCLANLSPISALSRAPMASCLATASRFPRPTVSALSRRLARGASVFVGAPSIPASFQWQVARPMRLQPMGEAGRPAWAKVSPGLSPSRQRPMRSPLDRFGHASDPALASPTASSETGWARPPS